MFTEKNLVILSCSNADIFFHNTARAKLIQYSVIDRNLLGRQINVPGPKRVLKAAKALPTILTLKAPKKNCSRQHFNFLLLSFEENKAWFFMWILCLAEDSSETSSLICSEKQWRNIYECRLLQSWLELSGLRSISVHLPATNAHFLQVKVSA